jgi:protein involved in polysaccharide export with SLBB domain
MMTAKQGFYQAVVAVIIMMVLHAPAIAQNYPSNVPPGLLDQLNRTQSQQQQIPYNPAFPAPSPLDQVRGSQQVPGLEQPGQNEFNQQTIPGLNPFLDQARMRMRLLQARSKLELDYSRRAGTELTQFGYNVFLTLVPSMGQPSVGAIGDNYVLGIGDELVVTLNGQMSRSLRTRVDSEGRVVVPELAPIPAAGRLFGDFRRDLEREVSATFLNTQVFVSVGNVREVAVAVLGEAVSPGIYHLGGLASVLDALAMAGGVRKDGSLRRITRTRGGQTTTIDLYSVFANAQPAPDLSIADGDRLMIPPIGPTVAVSDEVPRQGIYELPANGRIDAKQLLELAGGTLRPTGNRFVRLQSDAAGRDVTTESLSASDLSIRPGDILMVMLREDLPVGSVRLDGNVRVPGVRSLAVAPDVRSLIGSDDAFLDDPYLLFGAIQTTDPATRAHRLVPINLEAIMNGTTNVRLKDGDVVIVLSVGDINYMASADVQAVLEGKRPPLLAERIVTHNPRSSVGQRPSGSVEEEVRPVGAETSPTITQRAQNPQANAISNNQEPQSYNQQYFGAAPVPLAPNMAPGAAPGSTVVLIPGSNGLLSNYNGLNNAQPPAPFDKEQFAEQSLQICRGLQELVAIATTGRPGRFSNAIYSIASGSSIPSSADDTKIDNIFACPPIFDKYPELLPLIVENATTLEGEVRIPGPYPIVPGTSLSSVIDEAGGLAREVDLKRVEITHFDLNNVEGSAKTNRELVQLTSADLVKVSLSPGDIVRFNSVVTDRDNGLVSLSGEFRRPGFYDIVRGERLSQLIARAGGYTDQAYPYGAVFTRTSVRDEEARQYAKAAQQLQSGLPTALAHAASADQGQALVAVAQEITNEIKTTTPVGRVVVEADPAVLEAKPQLDPILSPGDTVFVPKRPFYVSVAGEVLNPTSLQFKPGATVKDYVQQAGGYTQSAEPDSVFIVLPNGEAETGKTSYWNFTPVEIPPGSTVVVPKNLAPFDLTTFLKDSTQILSQLAISGASLAVISGGSTR